MSETKVNNAEIPPYSAVALLMMRFDDGNWYQGTASFIGSRFLLTCSHNLTERKTKSNPTPSLATEVRVYWPRNQSSWPDPDDCTTPWLQCDKWAYTKKYRDGDQGWDVGMVHLSQPIVVPKNKPFAFFVPLKTTADQVNAWKQTGYDWSVSIAGYPGNHNGEPWTDADTVADADMDANTILYATDTFEGSSGSPVYQYNPEADKVYQIAVHVAHNPNTFEARRGVLITPRVYSWIRSATEALGS